MFSVLFSLRHGLFSWHPILIVGLLGVFWLWKKQYKILAFSFLGVFVLQWLLNAAVDDWWAGWSFGHRRFINLLPFFALGLAFVFSAMQKYKKPVITIAFVLLLSVWNQLFIAQYMYGLIPLSTAPTYQQMFIDKLYIIRRFQLKADDFAALSYLKQNNLISMEKYAKLAYVTNPSHINAHLIYGLFCILSERKEEGLSVFQSWNQLAPTDILAKYGLAEHFIQQGKVAAAAQVFTNCALEDAALCQTMKQKIQIEAPLVLLDQAFLKRYDKRLQSVTQMYLSQ